MMEWGWIFEGSFGGYPSFWENGEGVVKETRFWKNVARFQTRVRWKFSSFARSFPGEEKTGTGLLWIGLEARRNRQGGKEEF